MVGSTLNVDDGVHACTAIGIGTICPEYTLANRDNCPLCQVEHGTSPDGCRSAERNEATASNHAKAEEAKHA